MIEKCEKIDKNHRILYKGCQILKMDILKLSNSQKNFPLYKNKNKNKFSRDC